MAPVHPPSSTDSSGIDPWTLRFRSPALEREFQDHYFSRSIVYVRAAYVLGIAIWLSFGLLDSVLAPADRETLWTIRYGIVFSIQILGGWFVFRGTWGQSQIAMSGATFVTGLGVLAMTVVGPPELSYQYYAGLLVVIVYTDILLRLRFIYALTISWLLFLTYEVIAIWVAETPSAIIVSNTFFHVSVTLAGTVAAYSLERFARTQFSDQRMLQHVLRVVSHDLRNPLSTARMTGELFLELPLSEETRQKHVGIMLRSLDRMNRLIEDLLDDAQIRTGNLVVQTRDIPAAEILEEAREAFLPLATRRSLGFTAEATGELPWIRADRARLIQALSNVVGNAIKFTPAGGRIDLIVEPRIDYVWFRVRDTGPGIPGDHIPKLFEPFWQANRTDQRGIGLGLTIVKGLVEAHQGRIQVESEEGRGTTFSIGIPVAPAGNQPGREPALLNQPDSQPRL